MLSHARIAETSLSLERFGSLIWIINKERNPWSWPARRTDDRALYKRGHSSSECSPTASLLPDSSTPWNPEINRRNSAELIRRFHNNHWKYGRWKKAVFDLICGNVVRENDFLVKSILNFPPLSQSNIKPIGPDIRSILVLHSPSCSIIRHSRLSANIWLIPLVADNRDLTKVPWNGDEGEG